MLTAQQIALYVDRGLLIADGGVSIKLPTGTIAVTRAAYNLRTNRLYTAGPAYTYDLSAKVYIQMPSHDDAVAQSQIAQANVIAQQVQIQPAKTLLFTSAQVSVGGVLQTAASYDYRIPPPNAKNFGSSPVPSAALEYARLLSSTRNAYTFARVRYDRYNGGPGIGLEEHLAKSNRGYAVFGETLDADGARFDLSTYQRINSRYTQTLTASRLFGQTYARYAVTRLGARGYASLAFAQSNGTRSDDLTGSGPRNPLGHIGFFSLQADLGHDVHPFDGLAVEDARLTGGVHIDLMPLHLGLATLSTSSDLGETIYNYGRGTLATTLSFFAARPAGPHASFSAGATFNHNAPPFPSTYRTYSLGTTYNPNQLLGIVASINYDRDVPQYLNFGRPEYTLGLDLRIRRKKDLRGIETGIVLPFGAVGQFHNVAGFNIRFFAPP